MKHILLVVCLCILKLTAISQNKKIAVYSGMCSYYKKTLVDGNKVRYTKISEAFGKVVINRTAKRFTFWYDGHIIVSEEGLDSYVDGTLGGEGFTFNGLYSAHRLDAERTFEIYYSPGSGDLGTQYEIKEFKVN